LDETGSELWLMADFALAVLRPRVLLPGSLLGPLRFAYPLFVLTGSGSNPLLDPGVPICMYCHGKHSSVLWTEVEPTATHTEAVGPAWPPTASGVMSMCSVAETNVLTVAMCI
jgi:hypothetical protein